MKQHAPHRTWKHLLVYRARTRLVRRCSRNPDVQDAVSAVLDVQRDLREDLQSQGFPPEEAAAVAQRVMRKAAESITNTPNEREHERS